MAEAALKPATQDIVVDEVFPHAPETIWKALTTGDLIARWLMPAEGFQAEVGNRFTYRTTPAGAWDGAIHCEVVEVVPNERLAYSWKGGHEANVGYGSKLARDALAAERRRMPWLAVEKDYAFEGPDGKASLADLFDGRRQLIVYRAFYEPGVHGWPEHGCQGCSMVADQVAHVAHLNARDTTLVFASRAPQADIKRLKKRMGWEMPWVTVTDSFDKDFGVDEWHGTNVFYRDDDGRIFRTYFIDNRGDEQMGGTWNYLDITPLGRQEKWEDSPKGYPQTPPYEWWNWNDSYPQSTRG